MNSRETTLGGPDRTFPTTVWSNVLAAGDPADPHCRQGLDRLLRAYWKPVYAYIRAAWHKSIEDAKDLTQAFFTRVLEKGTLSRADAERGSFRGYLKKALKHFLLNVERADAVRRPEKPFFSLDAAPGELDRLGPAAPGESPERVYDRQWFSCVVSSSIAALEDCLTREGKKIYFDVFKAYVLDPADPPAALDKLAAFTPTCRQVADQLGLKETDVWNYIRHCRALLRQLLEQRIREYVETDADVRRELAEFDEL